MSATHGTDLIAAERERQITEEGYDALHDAGQGEYLAAAGAVYALPWHDRRHMTGIPEAWPWEDSDYKPTPDDRIRELVKAGALIAAAIDALADEQGDEDVP